MKYTIVSLAVALALTFIGCQENPVSDPILNSSAEKFPSVTSDTYHHGIIALEGVLADPYPVGNSFYRIYGQIEYEHRILSGDPTLPSAVRYASLYFTAEASFQYFCTVCQPSAEDQLAGFISEISEDLVPLGGSSVSLLQKTFAIEGREDGMVLKARFIVNNERVELSAMWLALPGSGVVATDINHY